MKYHRVLIVGAILTALVAQPLAAQLGIKGGLSYGTVSSTGALPGELPDRTGFALGISLASPGLLGIGADVLYAQREASPGSGVPSRELDYLDVPLYLRLMVPTPVVAPYAYAGPQVSFELRCQAGPSDCVDGDRPNRTYAGVIGAGVRFGVGLGLFVEGRYAYGLRDLRLGTVTEASNYRDRTFMILAGIGL
jgi:hypothetical protein